MTQINELTDKNIKAVILCTNARKKITLVN